MIIETTVQAFKWANQWLDVYSRKSYRFSVIGHFNVFSGF